MYLKVCDVGCGKGRYLKKLLLDEPQNEYYATDISVNVSKDIRNVKDLRIGSLTNIPYATNFFDFVYVCEAYEHAINIRSAFKELYRITKPGGKFVIIDKPIEKQGKMKLTEWEQWINDCDIKSYTDECGGNLEIIPSVPYEGGKMDGLFRAWIINKMC